MEDIRADMHTYERGFDVDIIPHINENNQIVDNIHNYKKGKGEQVETKDAVDVGLETVEVKKRNLALEKAPSLNEKAITDVLRTEIANPRTARLIGLVAHLAYWSVFG